MTTDPDMLYEIVAATWEVKQWLYDVHLKVRTEESRAAWQATESLLSSLEEEIENRLVTVV